MSIGEIDTMYPGIPKSLFRVHDWRNDVVTAGIVPRIHIGNNGKKTELFMAGTGKQALAKRGHDLIISVGQVVPHEVTGMANYTKNILVGTGGAEGINKSHFIGAVYGIERLLEKADNPVRQLLNYAVSKISFRFTHCLRTHGCGQG